MVSLLYSNNRRNVSHQEEVGLLFLTFVPNRFFLFYSCSVRYTYMSHNCNSFIIFCSSVFSLICLSFSTTSNFISYFHIQAYLKSDSLSRLRLITAKIQHSLSFSLSHTHTHFLSLSYTLPHSLIHPLTYTRTFSLALVVFVSEGVIDLRTGKKPVDGVGERQKRPFRESPRRKNDFLTNQNLSHRQKNGVCM